jgi:hypothetical protein
VGGSVTQGRDSNFDRESPVISSKLLTYIRQLSKIEAKYKGRIWAFVPKSYPVSFLHRVIRLLRFPGSLNFAIIMFEL